jgi:hypothetical protein
MPFPRFSEAQILELTSWVATYISEQRASFARKAGPLETSRKAALQQFFSKGLLDKVRVAQGRAPEPSFYGSCVV